MFRIISKIKGLIIGVLLMALTFVTGFVSGMTFVFWVQAGKRDDEIKETEQNIMS